jgi:FixJ family two-component response regulator
MTQSARLVPDSSESRPAIPDPTVFIIDDDAGVRDSVALLLGLQGLRVLVFACAEDFLAAGTTATYGCILLDIRMPGMGGLELQRELVVRGIRLPVIVMTAHGNIAASRTAFKAGAVDFLSKPVSKSELMDAIRDALVLCQDSSNQRLVAREAHIRLGRLTAREKDVLGLLVDGHSSREAADKLAISHRTVEVYKARLMEKLCARKLSDLMRITLLTQKTPGLS